MKVLYWAEAVWPHHIGGLEVLSAGFLAALQKRGYEIIVVTSDLNWDIPAESRYHDIPIYCFPFFATLESRNIRKLKEIRDQVAKLKQTFKPDLVHLNVSGPTGFFHLRTRIEFPAPTLSVRHRAF